MSCVRKHLKPAVVAICAIGVSILAPAAMSSYDSEACLDSGIEFSKGMGCWVYHDDGANRNKPVRVWYYYPPNYSPKYGKIVFAMHGSSRDADEAIERWQSFANLYGALIIAPEFSKEYYPKERNYARGNVRDDEGNIRDRNDWTYTTIEEIFDRVRWKLPDTPNRYSIQGHSAGGQFVHRMVLSVPEARMETAAAAGAGWYLRPNVYQNYPCGIANIGIFDDDLKESYGTKLVISLGTEDDDSEVRGLNRGACAEVQGSNRYERGHYFFSYAQDDARSRGHAFNWSVVDVQGVGHEADPMVASAAEAIFGGPPEPRGIALLPAQDATVKANYPRSNYGRRDSLQVDGKSLKTTYMQFDLRGVSTVGNAVLRLNVLDPSRATQIVRAVTNNTWDEDTLTYNNRPVPTTRIASTVGGGGDSWALIDITNYVALRKGRMMSIALESSDRDGLYFTSKESNDAPPELIIYD